MTGYLIECSRCTAQDISEGRHFAGLNEGWMRLKFEGAKYELCPQCAKKYTATVKAFLDFEELVPKCKPQLMQRPNPWAAEVEHATAGIAENLAAAKDEADTDRCEHIEGDSQDDDELMIDKMRRLAEEAKHSTRQKDGPQRLTYHKPEPKVLPYNKDAGCKGCVFIEADPRDPETPCAMCNDDRDCYEEDEHVSD